MIFAGKTVEEALKKASLELNIASEELFYEVISEKGFAFLSKAEIEVFTIADMLAYGEAYLRKIIEAMNLTVEITSTINHQVFKYELSASNNALLIGNNGATLKAFEVLVRNVIGTKYKKFFQVEVDINGYFKDKIVKLEQFAHKMAREVQRTQMDLKLDPMPNYDRKIIHNALQVYSKVDTKSYGEGRNRHLVIHYIDKNNEN